MDHLLGIYINQINLKYFMKIYLIVITFIFVLAGCNQNKDSEKKIEMDQSELKKKELELKEKELDIREKEIIKNKERELDLKEKEIQNQKEFIEYLNNTPKNKGTNSNYPGRFPEGSTKYLSVNEISGMSKYDLRLMRNEIFARHGYIFKSDDLKNYFGNQAWYQPINEDVTNMLSKIEKANIELIKSYE